MSEFNKKRKFDEAQKHSFKKFHQDNSDSRAPKTPQPATNHGLPPLPEISQEYRAMVFTHPTQTPMDPTASYDRLEFLGDAYLELYATQLIFDRFPQLEVGKLSQTREVLVKNETIGQYSSLYGLDKQLKAYKQFQNSSPHAWLKIKGDIFEAYVAGVVLSHPDGADIAKKWLHQLWEPKLQSAAANTPTVSKKSKEDLAKLIMVKGVKINYVDEKPPVVHYGKGKEEYFMGVYVTGWHWENQYLGSGKGFSRVEAGQAAAADALRNPLTNEMVTRKAEAMAEREKETAKPDDSTK